MSSKKTNTAKLKNKEKQRIPRIGEGEFHYTAVEDRIIRNEVINKNYYVSDDIYLEFHGQDLREVKQRALTWYADRLKTLASNAYIVPIICHDNSIIYKSVDVNLNIYIVSSKGPDAYELIYAVEGNESKPDYIAYEKRVLKDWYERYRDYADINYSNGY